jgi:hypothetical protein
MIPFLFIFGLAAAYCGWCLCLAAHRGDQVLDAALSRTADPDRDQPFEQPLTHQTVYGITIRPQLSSGQSPLPSVQSVVTPNPH